jgi:hypothetical protein
MERRYDVGYDWRNTLIDGAAVRAAGGGKVHETISILHFDVLFKCTLHLLNFEGTRCSTG